MGCRGSKPAQPPPPPPANGDDASPARGDGGGTRQGSTQDGVVERHVESKPAQREVSGASAYSTLSDEAATYAEMSAPPPPEVPYENPDAAFYENPDAASYENPDAASRVPYEKPDPASYKNPDPAPYENPDVASRVPYEKPDPASRAPSYEDPDPASSENAYASPSNFAIPIESQEMYDSTTAAIVDSMKYHPMVEASAGSVVILAGTESDGKAPRIVSDLLSDLRSNKVKTWDFAGRLDDNLVSMMRFILQRCATILVVATDSFAASQAHDVISYTKTARDIGKNVFAIKGQATTPMDEGILGLHFDEFFDLSMDPARGADRKPKAKAFRREFDKIVKVCSKNAAEAMRRAVERRSEQHASGSLGNSNTIDMARSTGTLKFEKSLSDLTFDPNKIVDPHGQAEAAKGRVLLLYSWGRKGKNGLYENQQKVLVVKNKLMSRGYKVWMDIDHPGTSEGGKGNFDGIMALAIYNSWVVVACVSNSFHLPDSPVNHAFIFALDKKQPGVSLFAMKLGKNTDMQAGVYGLYMNMQLYYDASMLEPNEGYDLMNHQACAQVVEQMTNDIVLVNPPKNQAESIYGTTGDAGIYSETEEIYSVADLVYDDTIKLSPAVTASKDAIMLSYSWGAKVGSAWPNREDVLALKDVLQRRGYKCWIDLDWMMGNMDKVMAGVIENSAVVLACIHPEYHRVGSNAQKEWVYTCKKKALGTDFLPLLMVPDAKVPEVVMPNADKAALKKATRAATKATIDISNVILGAKCGCGADWTDESSVATQQLLDALEAAGVRKFESLTSEPSVEGAINRQRAIRGSAAISPGRGSDARGSGKGPIGGEDELPLPCPPRAGRASSSGSQPMQRQPTQVQVVEVDADEKYIEPQALRGSVPATVTNQAVTNQTFGGSIPEQFRSHAAFIGKKMHKDAVNDLFERKSSPGEFVIRESDRHAGAFVLVVNDGSGVRQRKIGIEQNKILINEVRPNGESTTKVFTSLSALLGWLQVSTIPSYVFEFMAQDGLEREVSTPC